MTTSPTVIAALVDAEASAEHGGLAKTIAGYAPTHPNFNGRTLHSELAIKRAVRLGLLAQDADATRACITHAGGRCLAALRGEGNGWR